VTVRRLNHAVLYVRDVARSVAFYREALGFEVIAEIPRAGAAFLRAAGSDNHHDLGLFEVGSTAPSPPRGATGLYHLAWQVGSIEDLADLRPRLDRMGALVGMSDHGATKSLYAVDPDGTEFEVMWMVPRDAWGDFEHSAPVAPLDLDAEVARWGGAQAPVRSSS
jgi:catechol-2,3-dioxygenase